MLRLTSLAFATAATVALVSGPALAQPFSQGGYDYQYSQRDYGNRYRGRGDAYAYTNLTSPYVDSLEWRINNAADQGGLGRGEARRLLAELRQIQGPMIYRVETGRASAWEVRRVSSVVSRIEAATRDYAYNDRGRRYERRGY